MPDVVTLGPLAFPLARLLAEAGFDPALVVRSWPHTLLSAGRARTIAPLLHETAGAVDIELPPRSGAVVRLG